MLPHVQQPATRGLRWGAVAIGLLAVLWGASLGVREVLAYGLAHVTVVCALWLYPRLALRKVSLVRRMSPGACQEDEVPVRFELINNSPWPLFVPEIADDFAPDKVPHRVAFVFPLLGARRAARASYRGLCYAKRGTYAIGPARLHLSCPTGLFGASRPERRAAPLTVYPTLERLPPQPLGVGRAPGYGGTARLDAGDGDLTLAVREYRAGDPLRRIHWPSTARRGRLTILEYERQLTCRVALFLDASNASLRGLGRQSTLEVSVRTAAALAARALSQGDRVSLHAQAAQLVRVSAGRGDAQLCNVLAELARLRPTGSEPLSQVVRAHAEQLVRGQTAALVVADVEKDGEELIEVCAELLARRCQVLAALLDPASFPALREREAPAPQSVCELAEALTARGATVHLIHAGQPLAEALLHPYAGRPRIRISREALA